MPITPTHPSVFELADILRESWPTIDARLIASGVPLCRVDPPPPADPPPADPPADPPATDPPADPPADDWKPPTRSEYDNLQRKAREADTLRTTAEAAERKRLEDAGEHKKIAETERARADAATARAAALEEGQRVERIAARLKFRDPGDVMSQLTADERGDDAKAEAKLKSIAKAKPYLIVDGTTPKTRDVTGDDDPAAGGGGDTQIGPQRMARAYASKGK